jgi:hypothetical protein
MRAGRILAAILLLGGLIGVLVGAGEVFTRFLYLGLLSHRCVLDMDANLSARYSVKRRTRSLRASVGDTFEEHFELANESRIGKVVGRAPMNPICQPHRVRV